MSIFQKKSTAEALFRVGEGVDVGKAAAQTEATESVKKHEVYYVRGRPFIAPAKAGAPRLTQCTVGIAHRQVWVGAFGSAQSWFPVRGGDGVCERMSAPPLSPPTGSYLCTDGPADTSCACASQRNRRRRWHQSR